MNAECGKPMRAPIGYFRFGDFYRAMLRRTRSPLCHSNKSSVCPSLCPWRSGMFFTQVGILWKFHGWLA